MVRGYLERGGDEVNGRDLRRAVEHAGEPRPQPIEAERVRGARDRHTREGALQANHRTHALGVALGGLAGAVRAGLVAEQVHVLVVAAPLMAV